MTFPITVEIARVLRLSPQRAITRARSFLALAWGSSIGASRTLLGAGGAARARDVHESTGQSYSFAE